MECSTECARRGSEVRRVVVLVVMKHILTYKCCFPFSRSAGHIKHLLDLVASFPRVNPSTTSTTLDDTHEVDIPKLFRQIRSRYKALCASLGVRPSLRALEEDASNGLPLNSNTTVDSGLAQTGRTRVWKIEGDRTGPQDEGLSF